MFGKKILSGKTRGQKARGQRWAAQCVTEGLIAGAAVMVSIKLCLALSSNAQKKLMNSF